MKNSLDGNSIVIKIDINKNHIDNYVLEIDDGTKRTKEKFFKQAAESRNTYVNNQHIIFDKYYVEIKNELANRIKKLMPVDKTDLYNQKKDDVDNLFFLVQLYSKMSDSFKLKLSYIISSINDNTSLGDLTIIIKKFIERFKELGITLSIENFKYTMFTEEFMTTFFKTEEFDRIKETFESIYFKCPDIKLQMKMNLSHIVDEYSKQLTDCVTNSKNDLSKKYLVHDDNVIEKYVITRRELGETIAKDEYYNTKLFLDGEKKINDYLENSPVREKNYNTFAVNESYESLNEQDRQNFSSAMMGFYVTLNEFKKYFEYEFIVKDLLERYKNKDSVKSQYLSKKKEYEKEDAKRISIYKEYLKANGIGFLAKKNDQKIKDSMLKMNEQIKNLNKVKCELNDLEITYNLSSLAESSSIYDLLMTSLTSFDFLEKCFLENEKFSNYSLEDNIDEFFKFLYNPNNSLLRKINVFTDYNIVEVIADKYKLLNLNVTAEMVNPDNIENTMNAASFINLIQNIENSGIDIHTINNICRIHDIIYKDDDGHSNPI